MRGRTPASVKNKKPVSGERVRGGSNTVRRKLLAGISTNVLVLGVVSFLTDMSSEMIYPVLPTFLISIGATGIVVGLIEGAAETTASMLKVVSGWSSDKWKRRKPYITGGYGLSALVKPFLVAATAPWHVLGVRLAERVGKGIRSAPRDALIADSADPGVRGKAFGVHKAMDSLGAVAGPLAAIAILIALSTDLDTIDDGTYRVLFIAATVPAFVGVAVILLFVREREAAGAGLKGSFLKEVRRLQRPFWLLIVVVMAFYMGEISYAFFVLKAQDAGVSAITTIGLYMMFNVLYTLLAIPSGVLSDRIGRRPVMAVSFGIFALTCVVMALAGDFLTVAVGFAMFGMYKGTSEGVMKAFVIDIVPSDLRGTALGAFHTAVGLVMLPGGIIAGYLWDSRGADATFAFGAAMALTAIVLLLVLRVGAGDSAQRA